MLLFTAAAASAQQDTLRLTLEQCLGYALRDNFSRQATALNESSQEQAVKAAKGERLPNLTASAGENYSYSKESGNNWSGSYDLSTNITVWQGGQISNTVKMNEQQLEQTRLQTQQYDNDLTINVLQAFLTAIGNEELLKYQQSVLETSREQAAEGKIKLETGQILPSDLFLLESQYMTDTNNAAATQITLNNSLVVLKNLMSMELSQPLKLIYPNDEALASMLDMPTQNEVVERGMETMPDVKISEYNVVIAETGLRLSKSAYYPTLSANAGVGTGTQNFSSYGKQLGDRFGPSAGVSLSIPIFNRNRTKTDVAQSRIALQQAELDRRQSVKDIEQTLMNEYGNVVSSAGSFRASDMKQKAYKSSFDAYTFMFKSGSITTVELLQQQDNYISAVKDYIQYKYTFILQRKVLDVYMGIPVKM